MNSPLVPIFRKAIFTYRETGAEDLLLERWAGKDIPEYWSVEKNTLKIGQTFLVFAMLSGFYCLSLAMFLGEVIFSKTRKIRGYLMDKKDLA